jgi:hypothetical protein
MPEQSYPGNIAWNKKGDSLTIYIGEDLTLKTGDKLYGYRSKKKEDKYGRQLYYLTTTAKDYSKFKHNDENAEQPAEQPTDTGGGGGDTF